MEPRYLDPKTLPPTRKVERTHEPRGGSYTAFRQCLRWEFGFQCAFCLIHERDLDPYGTERAGLFGIEHFVPQKHDPELRNEYSNCFYACRFCNGARGYKPVVDSQERHLLHPCANQWSAHFALRSYELVPLGSDQDAEYTRDAYDINAPNKVTRRRVRRQEWKRVRGLIDDVSTQYATALRSLAVPERRTEARATITQLLRYHRDAVTGMRRFSSVPDDAASRCNCRDAAAERNSVRPGHLDYRLEPGNLRPSDAARLFRLGLQGASRIGLVVGMSVHTRARLELLDVTVRELGETPAITIVCPYSLGQPAPDLDGISGVVAGSDWPHPLPTDAVGEEALVSELVHWAHSCGIDTMVLCEPVCGIARKDIAAELELELDGALRILELPTGR